MIISFQHTTLRCFPYRPVSFPETNQRKDSYTVDHVLGLWGCAKGFRMRTVLYDSLPGGPGIVKDC